MREHLISTAVDGAKMTPVAAAVAVVSNTNLEYVIKIGIGFASIIYTVLLIAHLIWKWRKESKQ